MKGFFDFDAWGDWFRSLDSEFLYLLILALVILAVALWSKGLPLGKGGEPKND